jgi:proline iminopeptidase
MFYSWGASLEAKVNVVYLDQRGSGESRHLVFSNPIDPTEDEAKDYTISNLVKDIESVREFLKVDRWYVLGHAWGAMLGVEYVAAHSEHVSGLVIMDGIISQPLTQESIIDALQPRYEKQRESTDSAIKADAIRKLATIQLLRQMPAGSARMNEAFGLAEQNYADMYFARPDKAPNVLKAMTDASKKYSVPLSDLVAAEPSAALQVTEHYGSRDDTKLLGKITVPTLVLNGRQDKVITPLNAQMTKAGIKGSRLVMLDGCGHFPFVEQPELTTLAVLTFINESLR